MHGGQGGIRTPGTVARTPHFECGAFDHSATCPFGFNSLGSSDSSTPVSGPEIWALNAEPPLRVTKRPANANKTRSYTGPNSYARLTARPVRAVILRATSTQQRTYASASTSTIKGTMPILSPATSFNRRSDVTKGRAAVRLTGNRCDLAHCDPGAPHKGRRGADESASTPMLPRRTRSRSRSLPPMATPR